MLCLSSLAIEPLLHNLRSNLTGLRIPSCKKFFCLSAYADDAVIMTCGQKDVDILLNLVQEFGF